MWTSPLTYFLASESIESLINDVYSLIRIRRSAFITSTSSVNVVSSSSYASGSIISVPIIKSSWPPI